MGKWLLRIVIVILIVCSILLYLSKRLVSQSKEKILIDKNKVVENFNPKTNTKNIATNNEVDRYIKSIKNYIFNINKNWNIVKKYATIKTWLTDDNESKIKSAFVNINNDWKEISQLKVPENEKCNNLYKKLMECKNIQNHAMSLASEAMNTSSFDFMIESTEVIVDSNKFISKNIEPLIEDIDVSNGKG
ncbi:MAG: hypothetical protein ACRC7R_06940 [Sarcina sp.]